MRQILEGTAGRLRACLRLRSAYAAAALFVFLSGYYFSTLVAYYVRRSAFADRQIERIGRSDLQLDVPTVALSEFFKYEGFALLLVVPILVATIRLGAQGAERGVGGPRERPSFVGAGAPRPPDAAERYVGPNLSSAAWRGTHGAAQQERWGRAWGELLAGMALFAGMLALTLPLHGLIAPAGLGEPGVVAAGYLGLFLLGGAELSLGLVVSSRTRTTAAAVLATGATLAAMSFAHMSGWGARPLPEEIVGLVSLQAHYADFTRGVIALPDVTFFATWIVLGTLGTRGAQGAKGARGGQGAEGAQGPGGRTPVRPSGGSVGPNVSSAGLPRLYVGPNFSSAAPYVLLVACLGLAHAFAWARPVRIDMTVGDRNSLPAEMRALVAGASNRVVLRQFGRTRDPRVDWILATVAAPNRHVRQEFVDSARHPEEAARYGVTTDGAVVVVSGPAFRSIERPTLGTVAAAVGELSDPARRGGRSVSDRAYGNRRIALSRRAEILMYAVGMCLLPMLPLAAWLAMRCRRAD